MNLRDECFCGDSYGSYGTAESNKLKCDIKCSIDRRQICGGYHTNSVYCTGAGIFINFFSINY